MIKLFVKTGCQFCARAIAVLQAYDVPFEEKNVADAGVVDELIALGGKKQEPFLVDGDSMMYESRAIIDYVERMYGKGGGERTKPKIHFAKGTEVCPS